MVLGGVKGQSVAGFQPNLHQSPDSHTSLEKATWQYWGFRSRATRAAVSEGDVSEARDSALGSFSLGCNASLHATVRFLLVNHPTYFIDPFLREGALLPFVIVVCNHSYENIYQIPLYMCLCQASHQKIKLVFLPISRLLFNSDKTDVKLQPILSLSLRISTVVVCFTLVHAGDEEERQSTNFSWVRLHLKLAERYSMHRSVPWNKV